MNPPPCWTEPCQAWPSTALWWWWFLHPGETTAVGWTSSILTTTHLSTEQTSQLLSLILFMASSLSPSRAEAVDSLEISSPSLTPSSRARTSHASKQKPLFTSGLGSAMEYTMKWGSVMTGSTQVSISKREKAFPQFLTMGTWQEPGWGTGRNALLKKIPSVSLYLIHQMMTWRARWATVLIFPLQSNTATTVNTN